MRSLPASTLEELGYMVSEDARMVDMRGNGKKLTSSTAILLLSAAILSILLWYMRKEINWKYSGEYR